LKPISLIYGQSSGSSCGGHKTNATLNFMSRQNNKQRLDREILVLGAVVVLGTITAILDATIVNVAIPTLRRSFDAPVSSIQWVMSAYLLAFASVIPLTAWA